jgi:predicted transcriptional regulator
MPDIRTEAIKVMHSWSKPEKKELSSSDPLGKRMWEWLKQHPNSTIKQVCEAFPEQKDSSVATGLKSLIDRGILARRTVAIDNYAGMGRREHYIYRAVTPEYKTQNKGYSSVKKGKKVKVERATIQPKQATKPYDYLADTTKSRAYQPLATTFNAEELINTLTLQQAKEVYIVLKSVFK